MTDEINRKQERKELDHTITITDMINGGNFGEIVNITADGMMAITDVAIPTHAIYQLSLKLPKEINGSDQIELGADCLWCRKAENFHRYWAGFQIIDASDEALEQIAEIISDYAK